MEFNFFFFSISKKKKEKEKNQYYYFSHFCDISFNVLSSTIFVGFAR
jgi:hypothetical protein